jgi:hypothetical protein
MARIAYLLLCHGPPDRMIDLARLLAGGGDSVVVHHDANSDPADWRRLRAALADLPEAVVLDRRFRCGWGEWSLVAATLELARVAADRFPEATHFFLISGDCMPIAARADIAAALDPADRDHIEAVDFFTGGWIRTGLGEERLVFRHYVNERRRPGLFYAMVRAQRTLGLRRRLPDGPPIMIGAQWWCLRRQTMLSILSHVAHNPDLVAFFRRSWIPDETLFQTLAAHLVPAAQLTGVSPTFRLFTDYGLPAVFHNDHATFLADQPRFFARKIAPEARGLRAALAERYLGAPAAAPPSGRGERTYAFLTGEGRAGRRFGPRVWDRDAQIGRGRRLFLIACKRWHIGQAVQRGLAERGGPPGFGYVFDDQGATLPDLGGIEHGMEKRHRHLRGFVRLLFDAAGSADLALCLDPSRLALLRDFAADACETRLLDLRCAFSEVELAAHAARIGLTGSPVPDREFASIAEPLRRAIRAEADAWQEARAAPTWRVDSEAEAGANAAALAGFAGIAEDRAADILATPGLFD